MYFSLSLSRSLSRTTSTTDDRRKEGSKKGDKQKSSAADESNERILLSVDIGITANNNAAAANYFTT